MAARIAVGGPRLERLEAGEGGVEHLRRGLALHHRLGPRLLVHLDGLVEQERDHRLDLGEDAHALLHQRRDRGEGVERGLARG